MAIRVGVNGFGRIGRQVIRAAKQAGIKDIDFVAVNDLTNSKTLAHLLKYDSVLGNLDAPVKATDSGITVGGERARGQRLTDRHRMDPDGFLAVDVERDRQEAEPLPQRADVLLVPDRLVQEVGRHQQEDGQHQQAVGQIHRGALIVE